MAAFEDVATYCAPSAKDIKVLAVIRGNIFLPRRIHPAEEFPVPAIRFIKFIHAMLLAPCSATDLSSAARRASRISVGMGRW
jgi:hypothetical protein